MQVCPAKNKKKIREGLEGGLCWGDTAGFSDQPKLGLVMRYLNFEGGFLQEMRS